MNIFNSLGSNYGLSYILKTFTDGREEDLKDLRSLLEKRYNGKAILLYKGREALTLALKLIDLPEDSEIAINGFTCVAVFNAIRKAGSEPLCLDIARLPARQEETGGLNFTSETLVKALKSNKNIKVVVVQNTFGYPCDIQKIEELCRKHNLILIEDLAHCVGTRYQDGRQAGTVGDFVVLSFSQDKIIDAVSGGALVIRNKKYIGNTPGAIERHPEGVISLKDRIYPFETYKIRSLYKFGLGKPYHFLLKKLNLLSNVMNESFYDYYSLPDWNAKMALYQFALLEMQLLHRRKIADIYVSSLPDKTFMYDKVKTKEAVSLSSNLRFPIFADNRFVLINKLKRYGAYLSDIWYTDVAPECPNAVSDSKIIINLPTHINVSESDALSICKIINNFVDKERVPS